MIIERTGEEVIIRASFKRRYRWATMPD